MKTIRNSVGAKYCIIGCAAILSNILCFAPDAWGQSQDELPPNCGRLRNATGPWDYRTATQDQKELVENAHFYAEHSAYLKGLWVANNTSQGLGSASVAGGFDYTLRVFPNHYQALKAMDEMGVRRKMERLPAANYSVQCYFNRAVAFAPNDGLVRALYGAYLARRGKPEAAREQLLAATKLAPDQLNVRAQVASTYMQLGDWGKAEENAKAAYELGYPLPGLRDKLKAKGHWSQ